MNILFVVVTPGNLDQNIIALVPSEKIDISELDGINGKIVNFDNMSEKEMDTICDYYYRFSLESKDAIWWRESVFSHGDLKEYINPKYPFTVDKVVWIGWAI